MAATQHDYDQLKQIYHMLLGNIGTNRQKNQTQKLIYRQIIKSFHLFSKQMEGISTKINQQILKQSDINNDEYENNTYQYLSNSLLRLGQCSRKVALKCRNQILDPFNLFSQNYFELSQNQLKKIEQRINNLKLHMQEVERQKQTYRQSNMKLQRHKQQQTKMMIKIETNGVQSQNQLTKFNQSLKKMVQSISVSQKFYIGAIEKTNYQWIQVKQDLQKIFIALAYNQQSRNSFCRKSAINSIKALQQFHCAIDTQVQKKIQQSSKLLSQQKTQNQTQKKIKLRIHILANTKTQEQYVSYQQEIKQSRKQSMQAEQNHLVQIFQKVKDKDKTILKLFIQPWFKNQKKSKHQDKEKDTQIQQKTPIKQVDPDSDVQLQNCKKKILNHMPYTFYFIEVLYFKIAQMNSIYCKLNDQTFNYICQTFVSMINSMDLQKNVPTLNMQFTYKIIQISQRLMLRSNLAQTSNSRSKPIQLASQIISKNTNKFKNTAVLKKLFSYLEKRKEDKKKQGKSVINSLTKGFFAAVTGKKDTLTEDQYFSCMQQMANIMSNLDVPATISLPFLKQILGNQNQTSFDYLKSIILAKRDVIERQKIFYKKQIKEKSQKQMESTIKYNKIPQFCIKLVAKKGYLGKESIRIRQVCKGLSSIHQQILHKLKLSTTLKWPKMIPLDRELNFKQLQHSCQLIQTMQVDEIIGLDVNRSLHMHTSYLKPQILTKILRLYAYSHKQISYCQGMNYIAGYIYIKTMDLPSSYHLFSFMMQHRFKQLFANEFQILKTKMYQFQRLLSIYHPQIAEHFTHQSILPQCYIISWIITLFASSYQYTMESYLIDLLWERFIVWGWRQFFKFVLWMFSLYKQQLIQMTYDKALHFFSDLVKSKFFLSGRIQWIQQFSTKYGDVGQGIQKYHVTNELLQTLRKQYYIM